MITQRKLKQLYTYNPETGIFIRNLTGLEEATQNKYGYLRIWVNGTLQLCHRMAWLYMYGVLPKHMIDHINGIPSDNRIANLREATNSQNQMNSRIRKNNTSGAKGVMATKNGTWSAVIKCNKKALWLGTFSTKEAAIAARQLAEIQYFKEFRKM